MNKLIKYIFLNIILFSNITYANTINFTPEEKEYINTHPIIKVHNETNWPPYNYNKNGKAYGYSIEYMKLLASKINIKVDFISGHSWEEFMEMIKNNKIDVMLNIAVTDERKKFLSYTSTYYHGIDVIFTSMKNKYHNLEDFNGKTLSVVKGFYEEELLRTYYPKINILTVENSIEAIKAVSFGKADGAVDNLATGVYFISKFDISNIKPSFEIDDKKFNLDLHLATNKNNSILRDILEKAKKQLTEEELQNIKNIWLTNNNKKTNNTDILNLSNKQKQYLKNKKHITMCIDPNWMPFEKFDKNGKHVGITADYFKIFQNNLGIKIDVIKTKTWYDSLKFAQERKCDILSLAMPTKKREEYLNFTSPYLRIPLVLATKIDVPFVNNMKSIKNKKVGIPKGYAFVELLKEKYKNINIVEVDNIQDGLSKVNSGELFGYIGTLASVGYQFQTTFTGELKITGKFDELWELGIAVRNDDKVLLNIFQKLVNVLDVKVQQKILNDWISINYEKNIDYTLLWQLISIFLFILILILIFLYNQHKLKNKLKNEKEKLEAIYNGTKDSIAILDMQTNFLEVNNAYCEMTGFTKTELLNTSCLELTANKDLEASKNIMKEVYKIGFVRNYEKECIAKNKTILVNMSISLLHNPERILISVRDITEQKRKEKVFQEQSKLASMGEMIGNIAHQWRQPLSVISTAATSMQMQQEYNLLNEELLNKSCDTINTNAQYLSKTIDDFANFIKGDRKQEIFYLSDIIHSFLNLVEGTITKENINIHLKLEENIKVNGYQNELAQCFINLFNNAKDILVQNNIKDKAIFINTYIKDDNAIVEIKDNAGGVPEDIINKIFEPYFTTKHKSQGTGLGLHMTHSLIQEGMEGNISVQNDTYIYKDESYTGALFCITVPLNIKKEV